MYPSHFTITKHFRVELVSHVHLENKETTFREAKKNRQGENDGDLKALVYSINVWFPGVTLQGLSGSG